MSDFWTKKREELQQKGELPKPALPPRQSSAPWWAEGTRILPEQRSVPQEASQSRTRPTGPFCPFCQSENYMKPSSSMAARCFDCGHVEGRTLNEPNLPGISSPDAATLKVKQIQQGGHFGRNVAEINANNAALEQSAQGRAKLN